MIVCVDVTKVTIVTGRGTDKVGLHTTEDSPIPGMFDEQLMMSFTAAAGDGFRYVTEVLRIDDEYVEIINA